VRQALAARPIVDVAVSRRYSDSTGYDTLYAATVLVKDGPVLRLAESVDDVVDAAGALKRFARNVQAVAITVAFLLSLLSAVLFLRPLQRLTETARAMAGGDLAARAGIHTDDEVGDAARALDQMAVDLRRRLANAGSGDALLAQLVDALPVPCVVVEPGADQKSELLAINGPARRAFRVEGVSARRKVHELTQSGRFRRALEEAEADGDPEPCVLHVDDGVRFEALVHVLKRPGAAPLTVILGHEMQEATTTTLPPITLIEPRGFDVVLHEARARVHATNAAHAAGLNGAAAPEIMIEVDDTPAVLVADVDGRLARALALTFEACAKSLVGKSDILGVVVHVEATRVRLVLDAALDAALVDAIKPVLAPLGGDIVVDDKEARLWLPRA
jgi:HAMP domain-containing protein